MKKKIVYLEKGIKMIVLKYLWILNKVLYVEVKWNG